ncbi:MBL fold metallo-hydrolase [Thermostilla marina]
MKIQFLGAARQVTGSQYYLQAGRSRILVDCGMFQERQFQGRNWEPSPIPPREIDGVVLTHAHLDHCGLIPKLVKEGFHGKIYCTAATADLTEIILRDSAHIQMEDAAYKKKRHRKEGRKGKYPEVPLYTTDDVELALPALRGIEYEQPVEISDSITVRFFDAGHILGSALLCIAVKENGAARRIVFSGDLGQHDRPIIRDPTELHKADYIVTESTYGDRDHNPTAPIQDQLATVVNETLARGGNVVIPVFAVERAQELLYYFSRLYHENRMPAVPVYLDSPMAVRVTDVFRRHKECYDEEMRRLIDSDESPLNFPTLKLVSSVEESKRINEQRVPSIIMATSGMCTAGRIKHHLKHNIVRPESTLLFVGYQGRGTLGRQILDKNREIRIHGKMWPLRARVEQISGISGHADRTSLLAWLRKFGNTPRQVFVTHGEESSALAFAEQVRDEFGWQVSVPEYLDEVVLD